MALLQEPQAAARARPFDARVGDPVDLDDLRGKPITQDLLHEATDRIMAAITAELEIIRGEKAPAERFDPKKAGVAQIGNPHLKRTNKNKKKKDKD